MHFARTYFRFAGIGNSQDGGWASVQTAATVVTLPSMASLAVSTPCTGQQHSWPSYSEQVAFQGLPSIYTTYS